MNYDLTIANGLINSVHNLASFSEVQNWDLKARQEVRNIESFVGRIVEREQELKIALTKSIQRFSEKPFFSRLFSSDTESSNYRNQLKFIANQNLQLGSAMENLNTWIETTPDDEKEAKQMLAELRLAKKELGVQKREARADIKQINTNARIRNSNISSQIFFTSPKLKRYQRISVRVDKENALRPHENLIYKIDQQILEIDRMINWIERIRF